MTVLDKMIEEARERAVESLYVDDAAYVAHTSRRIALEDAKALMDPLLDALWASYKWSGQDTDGDQGPGALIAGMGLEGFAKLVVESVKELRQDYSEALRETA